VRAFFSEFVVRMEHEFLRAQVCVTDAKLVAQPRIEPAIPARVADAKMVRNDWPATLPHGGMRDERIESIVNPAGLARVAVKFQTKRSSGLVSAHRVVKCGVGLWIKHDVGVNDAGRFGNDSGHLHEQFDGREIR